MLKLDSRKFGPELMDDPELNSEDLEKVLIGLNRLNLLSNTTNNLFHITRSIIFKRQQPLRILDLGSGGGEVFCGLVKSLNNDGYDVKGIGCDLNSYSVERANRYAKSNGIDVTFNNCDAVDGLKKFEYDLVTSVLFLHHLPEQILVEIFKLIKNNARQGLAMIDLERGRLNYHLVNLGTSLVSDSKILKADGLQSVRSAFTISEMEMFAKELLPGLRVKKQFPCRMSMQWLPR